MRYIEYKNRIHTVYGDTLEWRKAGYAQSKVINYLDFIEKYADINTIRLDGKSFKVGKWIGIYTGKYQGVMQILSITKKRHGHDSAVWFETCYGWARFGDKDFVFDPGKFIAEKRKLGFTPREYNFAASFALKGDLKQAYADNILVNDTDCQNPISKKKPLPHLLPLYLTRKSVMKSESSMCPGS